MLAPRELIRPRATFWNPNKYIWLFRKKRSRSVYPFSHITCDFFLVKKFGQVALFTLNTSSRI